MTSRRMDDGIVERQECGMLVLSPATGTPRRRVLFLNSYGGSWAWRSAKQGTYPSHHLWGCPELVRMGYEVAIAEPIRQFARTRPVPHDLRVCWSSLQWLGRDGIVYCGNNVMFWVPLLRRLRALRCRIVTILYGRDTLRFADAYDGIVGLTPAAAERAREASSKAKVAHLGWGVDLSFYPVSESRPSWFLSCGKTQRDSGTLSVAASHLRTPVKVVGPGLLTATNWPSNVTVISGAESDGNVSYRDLIHEYYSRCIAALVILKESGQSGAAGFTATIEAMALARAVIISRTGTLPDELDVEKEGCGLFVPVGDPAALARAMQFLADDPERARIMGERGRQLCEKRYNIERYAAGLHTLFESL